MEEDRVVVFGIVTVTDFNAIPSTVVLLFVKLHEGKLRLINCENEGAATTLRLPERQQNLTYSA